MVSLDEKCLHKTSQIKYLGEMICKKPHTKVEQFFLFLKLICFFDHRNITF